MTSNQHPATSNQRPAKSNEATSMTNNQHQATINQQPASSTSMTSNQSLAYARVSKQLHISKQKFTTLKSMRLILPLNCRALYQKPRLGFDLLGLQGHVLLEIQPRQAPPLRPRSPANAIWVSRAWEFEMENEKSFAAFQ
jgi:hypothetical protein